MKYSTALTIFLACGPSAIMAAPVAQGATPALALRSDGHQPQESQPQEHHPHESQPQASPQATPQQGSSASGQQGQQSGNEGVLDKVEKILKDLLGGLRKRGVVKEVGDALKETLDSTSKLVNGEKSGSQSGFSEQSSNPDAVPHSQMSQQKQQGDDNGGSDSQDGGSGGVGKFLGGRSSPLDPVTNEVSSVPKEVETVPKDVPAAAPMKKSDHGHGDDDDDEHHHHHSSPESNQGDGFPSSAGELSPEQIAGIIGILNGGGAQKQPQIPGQDD